MVAISGVGYRLASTIVNNDYFKDLGVSDDWIRTRTGIEERHWLAEDETLTDLAIQASKDALTHAGTRGKDIDFVIAASSTPDFLSPGLAPRVAAAIGAGEVGALDISVACSGFIYSLDIAASRIQTGSSRRALVIGADAMSRLLDPNDPKSAPLFGDGAGAVIVTDSTPDARPIFNFGSDGSRADKLQVRREDGRLAMDGRDVYTYAVEKMSDSLSAAMDRAELTKESVKYIACHQANERITQAVVRQLDWPAGRYASYIRQTGNTSAASIPISLAKATVEGKFGRGDTIGLAAFGAGYNWGAGLITWDAGPRTAAGEH